MAGLALARVQGRVQAVAAARMAARAGPQPRRRTVQLAGTMTLALVVVRLAHTIHPAAELARTAAAAAVRAAWPLLE